MAQAGTGFSLERPVFNARPGHVEFVVYILTNVLHNTTSKSLGY